MERGDGNVLWLRTEQEGWNRSLNKNAKNGTELEDCSSTQNGKEQDGTELNRTIQQKRNENGTIYLKALVLERNGTISKKSERAQPYIYVYGCPFSQKKYFLTILAFKKCLIIIKCAIFNKIWWNFPEI